MCKEQFLYRYVALCPGSLLMRNYHDSLCSPTFFKVTFIRAGLCRHPYVLVQPSPWLCPGPRTPFQPLPGTMSPWHGDTAAGLSPPPHCPDLPGHGPTEPGPPLSTWLSPAPGRCPVCGVGLERLGRAWPPSCRSAGEPCSSRAGLSHLQTPSYKRQLSTLPVTSIPLKGWCRAHEYTYSCALTVFTLITPWPLL